MGAALGRWQDLYLLDRPGGHLKHDDTLLALAHALPAAGASVLLVVGREGARVRDQQHGVRRREVERDHEEYEEDEETRHQNLILPAARSAGGARPADQRLQARRCD